MKKGSQLTLTVSELGENGDGIAFEKNNFRVYISGAIPGDKVLSLVTESFKTYAKAKILKILEFSPERVKPECQVCGICGGCQIQQMNYFSQLELKRQIVKKNLQIPDFEIFNTIGSENIFRYRNKALIPFALDENMKIVAGIYAKNSHEIVDYKDCKLGVKENETVIKIIISHLKKYGIKPYNEKTLSGVLRHVLIRKAFFTGEIMVSLIINAEELPFENQLVESLKSGVEGLKTVCINPNMQNTNVIKGENYRTIFGSGYITDFIGDVKFKISPLSFYQINTLQIKVLYDKVLEFAQLTGNETVFDVYCGVGTISLFLAKKSKKVYGVEIIPQAIEDAKQNAEINNISNAEFLCGKAEEVIPEIIENQNIKADVVIVDPPRKGCEETLLRSIVKIKPKNFVYVSCNPKTLGRDIKFLIENGFVLEKVQPLDMFPHTVHVETIAKLRIEN